MSAKFRKAESKDTAKILAFIMELAEYENMTDEVTASEEILNEWLFEKKSAEVLFVLDESNNEIGYVLFFHNFSTFQGKAGLYLEDLYIKPEFRGRGYGKDALRELARIAEERGCGRIEWLCLDWNEPSIKFYLSLGAERLDDWTKYRLSGDNLRRLAWQK